MEDQEYPDNNSKVRRGINDAGGRRFLLSIATAILSTSLLLSDKIDQHIFRDLIIATVAVYIAGNTVQKFSRQDYYRHDYEEDRGYGNKTRHR